MPLSVTVLPCSLTPLPLIEMSWAVDCGLRETRVTRPAVAVAVVLVKAKPESAMSMRTTWALALRPPGPLRATDAPLLEADPLPPQPAISSAAATAPARTCRCRRDPFTWRLLVSLRPAEAHLTARRTCAAPPPRPLPARLTVLCVC